MLRPRILLILLAMSIFCAQEPSGVEVVKSSWSKIRIGWERDPFGGPLENFDEMRSRARNERRVASGGGERAKREAKADEANLAALRAKKPSQYYFIYKTKIKNKNQNLVPNWNDAPVGAGHARDGECRYALQCRYPTEIKIH